MGQVCCALAGLELAFEHLDVLLELSSFLGCHFGDLWAWSTIAVRWAFGEVGVSVVSGTSSCVLGGGCGAS